jgi:hybrid cluster-associated redox disulfide protein
MRQKNKAGDHVGPAASGPKIRPESLLGDVIRRYPEAGRIMREYGLHCAGCFFRAQETIEAGARVHGLGEDEIEEMVGRVNQIIKKSE